MAYVIAAGKMTLSVLEDHFSIASLLYCICKQVSALAEFFVCIA